MPVTFATLFAPVLAAMTGGEGAMVARVWRGVDRLVVECAAGDPAMAERLCATAIAAARRDSPWPVAARAAVPTLGRKDALLRVRVADDLLLVSVERAVVVDESEAGPAPLSVKLSQVDEISVARVLARAVRTALPWRHRPGGAARPRRVPMDGNREDHHDQSAEQP